MDENIYQQLKSNANVLTREQVKQDTKLYACGENSGIAPRLNDGDIISFPVKEKCLYQGHSWKTNKLLWTGVQVNDKGEFLPVWMFRKRPASTKDWSLTMQANVLYCALERQGQKDIDRVENILAGKTFKVHIELLTLINKEGKEYEFEIYLLEEIVSQPARTTRATRATRTPRRTANNA